MTVISLSNMFVITFVLLKTVSLSANLVEFNNGRRYLIEPHRKSNWLQAGKACIRSKGKLLSFKSEEEYEAIVGVLETDFKSMEYVWLGGHDHYVKEVDYQRKWWSMEGMIIRFTKWGKVEPNNHLNIEHCMVLGGSKVDYIFEDVPCETLNGYICELNMEIYRESATAVAEPCIWKRMGTWIRENIFYMF